MTDPNVIEALDSLTRMARYLVAGLPLKVDADRARAAVDALLAAAEKPAAPAIVPVAFNEDGDALDAAGEIAALSPDGWEAELYPDHIAIYVARRPGEDAGELVAKILSAGGRGP